MSSHWQASRNELRHGWLPLVTATVGSGTGAAALLLYTLGVFVAPLQAEFGWSRGQITSSILYCSLGLMTAGPVLGWLVDHWGERRVALGSIPLFALTVWALGRNEGTLFLFYACFFLASSLGAGTTPILYTRAVAARFDHARGLALGITLAGPGAAAMLLPAFISGAIEAGGWRHAYTVLAGIALCAWPLAWLGLAGRRRSNQDNDAAAGGVAPGVALRSRVYWTVALCFMAASAAAGAIVVHLVPMLLDAGVAATRAASIASLVGVGVLLGRLVIGWLVDHLFAPYVGAAVFAVAGAGCGLLFLGDAGTAPLAAFLIGFALGAEIDLVAYLVSRYFGLRHYGLLYSVVYAGVWLGIASGPAVAGRLFDAYGNYQLALQIITGLFLFACFASLSMPRFPTAARIPAEN